MITRVHGQRSLISWVSIAARAQTLGMWVSRFKLRDVDRSRKYAADAIPLSQCLLPTSCDDIGKNPPYLIG
jgi:hypothetical protein